MKKKLLYILLSTIFICWSNNCFAQYWEGANYSETIDPSQSEMASTWFVGKYGGTDGFNWNSKQKKPRKTTTPITKGDLVAEMTKDTETGLTTVRWNNGAVYVGEINYGEISGTGTMIYPDKGKYLGQWKYSYRDGIGTMEYADGSKYVGEWVRDLPNGSGTFINPEGIAFTGKFKDGIPHGKCVMQDLDGRLYSARWVHGVLKEKSIKPLKEE